MKKRTLIACLMMGALLVPSLAQAEDAFFPDATGTKPVHTVTTEQSIEIEKLDENAEVIQKEEADPEAGKVLKKITLTIGSDKYFMCKTICGEEGTLHVAPLIQDNRTFIPLRDVGEALGATVDYVAATDDALATITIVKGDKTIVMNPGEVAYTVNGEEKTLDAAPFINEDFTMVPLRFVAEAFGYEVEALANDAGLTEKVIIYVQPREVNVAVQEEEPAVEEPVVEEPVVEEEAVVEEKADGEEAEAEAPAEEQAVEEEPAE